MKPADSIFREDPEDGGGRLIRNMSISLLYVRSEIMISKNNSTDAYYCSLEVLKSAGRYVGVTK
jgi:hypothetical protein